MSDEWADRRRRQSPLAASDAPPHPVFEAFRLWIGEVEAGWDVNFLGVRTRVAIDIQGAESDALERAVDALAAKVKRVYVAIHDPDNEVRVRVHFDRLGWTNVYDFPASGVAETP